MISQWADIQSASCYYAVYAVNVVCRLFITAFFIIHAVVQSPFSTVSTIPMTDFEKCMKYFLMIYHDTK